ncbi:unnamed protein product [Schistosoma curassoni]|uniref:Uncharacterized protein n=1 Tax=Schistosoma curassoni TaxID=6186 RepID=A0A183K9Y7_9TREM|nr:unnamed protein product [Schistosoma curassoni]
MNLQLDSGVIIRKPDSDGLNEVILVEVSLFNLMCFMFISVLLVLL